MRKFKFAAALLLAAVLPTLQARAAARECVNVFYDRGQNDHWMGKTYATFLQNLLGHFPEFQQVVSPIELYEKGQIEQCRATFYLGSYFENAIPTAFYEDYLSTRRPVAWLGYSVWKLGEGLERAFGYRYESLTVLDRKNTDEDSLPGFFRHIDYKGATFHKFAEWSKTDTGVFLAPFEQVKLAETVPGRADVLAWARHSGTNERIPYALRAGNRFYVADIPFSFMHESDRYLVFADLLFDILGVPPKRTQKLALVRVEDVMDRMPLSDLYGITRALESEGVPINISLIPIFFDPLRRYTDVRRDEYLPMDRVPEFLRYLNELPNPSFIWHGVTHQYGRRKNPHNGTSGDDFEFWDALANTPVAEDSVPWVLDRLHEGLFTIQAAGLTAPRIWLTPHYQASALDYVIFARVFPWNVGRVIYFDFAATGLPAPAREQDLWYREYDATSHHKRREAFASLQVRTRSSRWAGQFFPYEIYGDVYGQRLIPENLGNSQPYISEHVVRTRSVRQMVEDAKRNLVIRDAFASFFYHPSLLQPFNEGGRGSFPGDPAELLYLVREIKKLGYQFVSADEFAVQNHRPIRPEPIYRESP